MSQNTDPISTVLQDSRIIAVVGLSAKANRPSHEVAQYMQAHGYRIIPVNPMHAGTDILGEFCYGSLTEAADALRKDGIKIDIANYFRQSAAIPALAEEAIRLDVPCLWMQLGVVSVEAETKARDAGLTVVMDRCIKIEHMLRN